jgi:hypothetical protein
MAIWITVIAIALIALVFGLGRLPPRRGAGPGLEPERKETAPIELGATIRSYVIPKRWLRASPGAQHARADAAAHARYSSASVERVGEPGSATASWPLLRGRTRLGRDSDNHVVLDDERVSLHHALITVRDGVYWLEDLGSTNGTFVGDDKRVMAAHPLVDGEQVRLGGVELVFRGATAG